MHVIRCRRMIRPVVFCGLEWQYKLRKGISNPHLSPPLPGGDRREGLNYHNKIRVDEDIYQEVSLKLKRPSVNYSLCNGCGSCAVICSGVFRIDDDGKAWVTAADCCTSCIYRFESSVCPAIKICPKVAISLD